MHFRFDSSLGSTGGDIFNLKTTGLVTGTYTLTISVTGRFSHELLLFRLISPPLSIHHQRSTQRAMRFVVYSGSDRYPIRDGVEVIGLHEMTLMLGAL